jgi:hypothetical protein
VAMGLGWWISHWNREQRFQRELSEEKKRTLYWQLSAAAGGPPNNLNLRNGVKAAAPSQPAPKTSN